MSGSTPPSRLRRSAPTLLLLAGLAAWLWPIGLGGRMPVGGDVTQFSLGLMGFLHRSLRALRLPLWNDLWGYGFPGLAESQMGVYYPPHWLLYGLLPTEAAYTASLVLHTFWGGLGASWAARRFGASRPAAALGGFVWATSGFFVVHITHQWGYTVGSWMPWAWGLAWGIVRGTGGRRDGLALAAVMALQVLPGHFQLAFITQVSVLALTLWGLVDCGRGAGELPAPAVAARSRWGGLVVMLAWMAAGFLAACQLVPTWELARRAASDRTFAYLSGFAYSPIHLVSYVAPGLFHRSPLWRPLAWDPFHTSPEEALGYVGLAPLWLALAAVWREGRRDPAVRALAVAGLVTLLLSLGPYVPGFARLIDLPGFGFFRAPARWGAATMLALGLLAALGFDRLGSWTRTRGSLLRFAALAVAAPALGVMAVELALAGTERGDLPGVADAFEAARRVLPWSRTGSPEPDFAAVMAAARRPSPNPIVRSALGRRGLDPDSRFDAARLGIYAEGLRDTALLVAALAALAALARTPRALALGLAALTAGDLLVLGRHRDVDLGPIRPLVEQSPVLRALAESSATTRGRSVDPLGNLPMLVGAAPASAYRTLDVPTAPGPTREAAGPLLRADDAGRVAVAMAAIGATLRVLQPGEPPPAAGRGAAEFAVATVADPALAGWLYGRNLLAGRGASASTFSLARLRRPTSRAWLWEPTRPASPSEANLAESARPLPWRSAAPESIVVEGIVVPRGPGQGATRVVVTQLDDPEWQAVWVGPGGEWPGVIRPFPASEPAPGHWIWIGVPGPGRWTLHLRYAGRAAYEGLAASAVAWLSWLAAWIAAGRRSRTRAAIPTSGPTTPATAPEERP